MFVGPSAATRMNLEMSARVLRAPLAFFHTNPAGRVLNRFSKDQGAADDLLPQARPVTESRLTP